MRNENENDVHQIINSIKKNLDHSISLTQDDMLNLLMLSLLEEE